MVKTDNGDIPTLERIRRLQDLEKEEEEEVKRLEQKKKTLHETKQRISESIKEQKRHEEEQLEDEEEQRKQKPQSLDDKVADAPETKTVMYGDVLQQVRQGQQLDLYAITNYNVVGEVERLQELAEQGRLTSDEERFLQNIGYSLNKIQESNTYMRQDQQQYFNRVEDVLRDVDRKMHLR